MATVSSQLCHTFIYFFHLLPQTYSCVHLKSRLARIYPTSNAATGNQTHVSSVVPLLWDLNPECFTDWATKATAKLCKTDYFIAKAFHLIFSCACRSTATVRSSATGGARATTRTPATTRTRRRRQSPGNRAGSSVLCPDPFRATPALIWGIPWVLGRWFGLDLNVVNKFLLSRVTMRVKRHKTSYKQSSIEKNSIFVAYYTCLIH